MMVGNYEHENKIIEHLTTQRQKCTYGFMTRYVVLHECEQLSTQ